MNQFWIWDMELYRAIHVGMRRDWLDPIVQTISDCGLGHTQWPALAIAAARHKLHWGWILALSLFVMGAVSYYEFHEYGKLGPTAAAYLVCLGLFWFLPPWSHWWAILCSLGSGIARLLIVKPISRQRPSNFEFAQTMEPIFGATSFPSGHATSTFAIAVFLAWVLSGQGKDSRTLGTVIILWACLVAFARVYVGVHFPTDILAGAALGTVGGTLGWMLVQKKGLAPEQNQTPESAPEL